MSQDYRLFLADIRLTCEKILRYTSGLTLETFEADEMRVDAVLRNLMVIGEAVKRLPQDFRDEHKNIRVVVQK